MNISKATLALFTMLTSVSASAGKSPVQPDLGEKACFVREYSDEHLRKNPKQLLSTMYVLVEATQHRDEANEVWEAISAKIVGTRGSKYFVNEDAICDYDSDGSIRCGVECDGGAFELRPRPSDVLFQPDSIFPLYKNGTNQETATAKDTISLRADDRDNAVYKLYPADPRTCEAALARAKMGKWGC